MSDTVTLEMVCNHPPHTAEADALLGEAYKRLSSGPAIVTAENFLSAVIYELDVYRVHITGIYADQWAMVTAEQRLDDGESKKVSVTCDLIEHGLAAIWKYFADQEETESDQGL